MNLLDIVGCLLVFLYFAFMPKIYRLIFADQPMPDGQTDHRTYSQESSYRIIVMIIWPLSASIFWWVNRRSLPARDAQ